MLFKHSVAAVATTLLGSASAFPVVDIDTRATDPNRYIAPGPTDSRSPCPGLNTLANHGYLPRNGRNVTKDDINNGFLNGFGMDSTTLTAAMNNAFSVCYYVTGAVCSALPNLTVLAEPHTLEHDHSFSREDYHMAYLGKDKFANNQNFNKTIFDTSIAALGGATHMDYAAANKVRLTRQSIAWQWDLPGWLLTDSVVQGVELGFIFGVMSDPTLSDYATKPQVRVDWWKYWTVNESFPTPLGWKKPSPARNGNFVFSVSSAVLGASVSSTPQPQPPRTAVQTNVVLGTTSFSPVLPVPTNAPYVAPGFQGLTKRDGEEIEARDAAAAPSLPVINPYVDELSPEEWASVVEVRRAHVGRNVAARATPAP